jgi:hypothetical protein
MSRYGIDASASDSPGRTSAAFIDPDGHPWEIAHNPGWTLRDDGSIELASD